jgi:hypothetical protein
MTHFLYVPFTGLGLRGGYRGDTWLKNRIRIFKEYTLKSILNQTNQNFVLWISWRPEDYNNPIVEDLFRHLSGIESLDFVFTYRGPCFWDDKYENDKLMHRLANTLPRLEPLVQGDHVLMTIYPSDDMYMSDMVETMQNWPSDNVDVMGYLDGYIMQYSTKKIAEYNPETKPPFFTIRFPRDVFLDPVKHYEFTGPYKSHEFVGDTMRYLAVPGRGFVVGTHGENISTVFNHPYKGRELSPASQEADLVKYKTGTYYSDPLVTRQGLRLWSRRILNILPFESVLRAIYHALPSKYQKL